MSHTPGKLIVRETDSNEKGVLSFGLMAGEKWLGELCEGTNRQDLQARGWLPLAEAEANARRLVAAWNFVDGFDTDTIESGPAMAELVADYTGGASKELLAACKAVLASYDHAYDGGTAKWLGEDVDVMRAAVAKAEGKS